MTKEPTLAHRLVLYPIVAAVFTILAAFIVYSALGYDIKFNDGELSFKKTGLIVLATRPGDARVYIDDKLYRKKTPTFSLFTLKIAKISSGPHKVRLEKAGYETWEGVFDVESGLVSWGNHVLFVPLEKKIQSFNIPGKISQVITSKDKTKELILADDFQANTITFWEVNTENKEKRRIYEVKKQDGEKYFLYSYSSGEERVLFEKQIGEKKTFHVIEAKESGQIWDISSLFDITMDQLVFNPRNHNELYVLREGHLYNLNYSDKRLSAILESKVTNLYPEETTLHFVQEVEENFGLYRLEANGSKTNIVKSLPFSDDYQIQTLPEVKQIAILLKKDKDLYLYSEHSGKPSLKRVAQNVNYFLASPRSKYLGYSKEDDFYILDIEKEKTFEAIKDRNLSGIAWMWDEGNLLFSENGKAYIVNYNGFYSKELFSINNDFPVVTGPNPLNVFFVASESEQKDNLYSFSFDN